MWLTHLFLAIGWIAYCCLHSILVTNRVKSGLKSLLSGSSKYYRLAYSIFSLLGLLVLIAWQFATPSIILWETNLWSLIPGLIISICGLAFMVICLQKYFNSHEGLKELVRENKHPVLLRIGLHRFVRHPLYLSTFVFLWGLLLVFPFLSLLITNCIITTYTLIAVRFEERKLMDTFGEAYTQYSRDVPRIIPRIRRKKVGSGRQSTVS